MTRRTFLVPLFAAALILAPAEISGQIEAEALTPGPSPACGRGAGGEGPGSPATSRRTG